MKAEEQPREFHPSAFILHPLRMDRQTQLDALHAEIRACRKCLLAGYDIVPGGIFSGKAGARIMIVGQAPGTTEVVALRPFNASAGKRLFQWLGQAGFGEADFRANQYISSVTKCYPGRMANGSKHHTGRGDRRPSKEEQALCRPYLDRTLALVQPEVMILVGGLAIEKLLVKYKLCEIVVRRFKSHDAWYESKPLSYSHIPQPTASIYCARTNH